MTCTSIVLILSMFQVSGLQHHRDTLFIESKYLGTHHQVKPPDSITLTVYVHFVLSRKGAITEARVDSLSCADYPLSLLSAEAVQLASDEALRVLNDLDRLKVRVRRNTSFILPMRIKHESGFFIKEE